MIGRGEIFHFPVTDGKNFANGKCLYMHTMLLHSASIMYQRRLKRIIPCKNVPFGSVIVKPLLNKTRFVMSTFPEITGQYQT